jgi:formylglycine-generating enzyme required for sulfatase activity
MKFVPVLITGGPGGQYKVLFSVWETRVQDFEVFVTETKCEWPKPAFEQGPTHPAGNVTWKDAQAFCAWLTERERRAGLIRATERYRLPLDHEWSRAIGSTTREDPKRKAPTEKSGKVQEFPWGAKWPPVQGAGNYYGEECVGTVIQGYKDNFPTTAPVGSFKENRFGLCDLGGNVWELCEDLENPTDPAIRTTRGASYLDWQKGPLWWSARGRHGQTQRSTAVGFRVVLAPIP